MNGQIAVILGFLAVLTGVGVYFARRIRTAEDFALAGRGLGVPVLAGTLIATWIGTGSLFGLAEFTVNHGVAGFIYPLASPLGIIALSFLAPRARALPAETVPQILGVRFGVVAQRLGAVTLILAYLIIVSYQYRAGAALLGTLFPDSDPTLRVLGCALFVTLFTVLAGMFSVAFTDVVCGGVMIVGLLVAAALLTRDAAAADVVLPPELRSLGAGGNWVFWLGVTLPPFLLVLGDANLHQRFLSARGPSTARAAALWMFFGVLIVDWAIVVVALFGGQLLDTPPENPAHVVILAASALLPAGVGLMILAASVAVIISTADSYLLASAVSAAGDFDGRLRTPKWQRTLVVVLGVVALGPAFMSDRFFSVAIYAYTLYGASLTPAVLLALLRPRTGPAVVISGMSAGLAMALAWKAALSLGWLPAPLDEIEAVLPALLANAVAMGLAALVTRRAAQA